MNTKALYLAAVVAIASACTSVKAPEPCGPVPSENQLKIQDMETYAFLHYSMNTYTDEEWGYGNEDLSLFNPSKLDARQWARSCKAAGMKGIIFTAKHHCGFCMWPSAYTEFSVKNTPWKDGKGDVVRELADACREEGLRFAVYLSPWDRNHAEYGREEYVTYFRNQLTELLTQYGDMFEVWFDGANGGNGWYGGADETRHIDNRSYYGWKDTYALVRSLQKDICVWGDNSEIADLRWVGNERGFIGERNWALLEAGRRAERDELAHGVEDGNQWVFGEADVSIRPGWFYHKSQDNRVKTLSQLMEIYYKSVGRNGTLLLNFPITPEGLVHPIDSARGVAFAAMLRTIFDNDLAKGASASATNERGGSRKYAAALAVDGNEDTYWATDDGVTSASLTLDFGKPVTFNRVMAMEYVKLGQRVKKFSIEALVDGEWLGLSDVSDSEDAMTTIGRKRIICLPEDVTATGLRFNVLDSKACPLISTIGVFKAPELTPDIPDSGERYSAGYTVTVDGPAITVDLGGKRRVSGFRYQPPQAQDSDGIITDYVLKLLVDGKWVPVSEGEFANVVNNPIWQDMKFSAVEATAVRLEGVRLHAGTLAGYEDFDVICE